MRLLKLVKAVGLICSLTTATSIFADIIPDERYDPATAQLALPELAATGLFQYYKNAQCIKQTKSTEFVPYTRPGYKLKEFPAFEHFVSFQICDEYVRNGGIKSSDGTTDYHECKKNCRPILPELAYEMESRGIPLNTHYFFDVQDLRRESLMESKATYAMNFMIDFASFFPLMKGLNMGLRSLGWISRAEARAIVMKALIKEFPDVAKREVAGKMVELSSEQIAREMFTRGSVMNPLAEWFARKYAASGPMGKPVVEFVASLPIAAMSPVTQSMAAVDEQLFGLADVEGSTNKLMAAFGSIFSYDYHLSLKRYTDLFLWNDLNDKMVRTDAFRLTSQSACKNICNNEFRREMGTRYMMSHPSYRGCTYDSFAVGEPQLNDRGININSESCKRSAVDIAIMPLVSACIDRCETDCMAPEQAFRTKQPDEKSDKYKGKTPRQKAFRYLMSDQWYLPNIPKYPKVPPAPNYAEDTECAVFPEYIELSIPEIALLWASMIRNAAPAGLRWHEVFKVPSKLGIHAKAKDPSIFGLDTFEPLIPGHPHYLMNAFKSVNVSSYGASAQGLDEKRADQLFLPREQVECPNHCKEQKLDFEYDCLAQYPLLRDKDIAELDDNQKDMIAECGSEKVRACLIECNTKVKNDPNQKVSLVPNAKVVQGHIFNHQVQPSLGRTLTYRVLSQDQKTVVWKRDISMPASGQISMNLSDKKYLTDTNSPLIEGYVYYLLSEIPGCKNCRSQTLFTYSKP